MVPYDVLIEHKLNEQQKRPGDIEVDGFEPLARVKASTYAFSASRNAIRNRQSEVL